MKRTLSALLCAVLALALCACSAQMTPTPTMSPLVTMQPTVQATMQPTQSPTAQATLRPTETPASQPAGADTAADAKDGTYTARMSEAYAKDKGHGWEPKLTVVFNGGAVKDVDFDAYKDGERKSAQSPEAYPMEPHPSEWLPKLAKQIQAAQSPADIDGVTGATQTSDEARRLFAAVLKAAARGDTKEIVLD